MTRVLPAAETATDPRPAHLVQFKGNRFAQMLLRLIGWRFEFDGLPALQGVAVLYPHTSNWDFPIAMLLKLAMGIDVRFWGKDSLFRIPLFGRWVRWMGGVPLRRNAAEGVVEQMVELIQSKKDKSEYFWLALSPEGTRAYRPGWRSGFYRVAVDAQVPLMLACLDYSRRVLVCRQFLNLCGDPDIDMPLIAQAFEGASGYRPELAAPVRLMSEKDKK